MKVRKIRFKKMEKNEILFYLIIIGVVLTSVGIFIMKNMGWLGSKFIIIGMSLFYFSVIILTLII